MNGLEIAKHLLNNTKLLKKHLKDIYDKLPKSDQNKEEGLSYFNINVRADDSLIQNNNIIVQKDKLINIEMQVKNFSDINWSQDNISVHLPEGIECLRMSHSSLDLPPMAETTIRLTTKIKDEYQNKNRAFALHDVKLEAGTRARHHYLTNSVIYENSIHLPFKGRNVELKRLREFFNKKNGIVVIEGFSGEGKSRLIHETCLELLRRDMLITNIRKHELSDTHSILKAFYSHFLDEYMFAENEQITYSLLSRYLKKLQINDNEFLDFIVKEHTDDIQNVNRFVDYFKIIAKDVVKTSNEVIILDDLHSLAPQCVELLMLIISELEEHIFFILSYRSNEIDKKVRQGIYSNMSELILLDALDSSHIIDALNDATQLDKNILEYLADQSLGNPFCLVESLRLLEESDKLKFDENERLIETSKNAIIEYLRPKKGSSDEDPKNDFIDRSELTREYAYFLSTRRYRAILEHSKCKKVVKKITYFIAALGEPLPISIFEKEIGGNVNEIIEYLVRKNLLLIKKHEFMDEDGVYFIHDRMMESVRVYGQQEFVYWGRTNRKLAEVMVKSFSQARVELYSEALANLFETGGHILKHIKYLMIFFYRCKKMTHAKQLVKVGSKLLDSFSKINEDIVGIKKANNLDRQKENVLLNMGTTLYTLRKFSSMEYYLERYLKESPVSREKNHIVNVCRTSADTWRDSTNYDGLFSSFNSSISYFEKIKKPSTEIIEAHIEALVQSYLYLKTQKADYAAGKSYLYAAEKLCLSHKMELKLTWVKNHHGTLLLFKDEEFRDQLEYKSMPELWENALNYWSEVLDRAHKLRFMEYIVELNSSVGFLKMFIGYHFNDQDLIRESEQHLNYSRKYAEKHGHVYWLSKLHNHFGILNSLKGLYDEAEQEFIQGLVIAKENDNNYTSWMMYQGLAYVSEALGDTHNIQKYWKLAFEAALNGYFKSVGAAVINYNFRQFYRAFLVHADRYKEVAILKNQYPQLTKKTEEDSGLQAFKEALSQNGYEYFVSKDMYITTSGYFNSH